MGIASRCIPPFLATRTQNYSNFRLEPIFFITPWIGLGYIEGSIFYPELTHYLVSKRHGRVWTVKKVLFEKKRTVPFFSHGRIQNGRIFPRFGRIFPRLGRVAKVSPQPPCPKTRFFEKNASNRILVLHGFIQDVVRKYFPPFSRNGNLFTDSQVLGYLSKSTFPP